MWINELLTMAFHNTYNKQNIVEEYKKRFQQILEYTSPQSDLQEAGEDMPSDGNEEGGPDAMGDGTDMAGDPNAMGGNTGDMGGDPNMMGGDPNAMGGDPNMMGDPNNGGDDLTSGFNPQGVDGNSEDMGGDPNMMGDPNAMGGDMPVDTMQPEDEVVDITELTDAQEETQEDIEKFDKKFVKAIKAIENIETLINKNNDAINSKIAEIEQEMKKRNPTPMEKLSNRAANSYPFNISPEDYWEEKEKNSNYSTENDNNGVGQEQYTITGADINGATDWKNISDSLSDDILYNQTLNNILKL